MKKSVIYFLIPLVGLIVFGAAYWNFSKGYDAHLEQVERDAKAKKAAEQEAIAKERLQAAQIAIADQAKRKADREMKAAQDVKDRDAREALIQSKNKALIDQDKLEGQVRRLNKDIEDTKKAVAKNEEDKKEAMDEQTFLKEYVKKAEANTKSLSEVLDKIAAADDAAAKAAAAAAAAVKK